LSSSYPHTNGYGAKLRQLILFAMLAAIMVIFKEVNPIRSNIEIVSTLIVVYTCIFGLRTLIPVFVYVLVETAIYGFDIWTVNYIYIWAVLVLVSLPFKSFRSPVLWAIIAGIYGLLFGALCAIPYFFIGGVGAAVSYWISGLPFDFIHCAGNFMLTLIFYKPLYKLFEEGKNQLQI
jgi:energy-coupling factor transport system substrate-specific component